MYFSLSLNILSQTMHILLRFYLPTAFKYKSWHSYLILEIFFKTLMQIAFSDILYV